MTDGQLEPAILPFFFAGLWLAVTTVLSVASGWFRLQRYFPPSEDAALLTLRGRSGLIGPVNCNGILTLAACRSGLRVSEWKLFAPFQRAILVPWNAIVATPSRFVFLSAVQLQLGDPEIGRLKIRADDWERLRIAGQRG